MAEIEISGTWYRISNERFQGNNLIFFTLHDFREEKTRDMIYYSGDVSEFEETVGWVGRVGGGVGLGAALGPIGAIIGGIIGFILQSWSLEEKKKRGYIDFKTKKLLITVPNTNRAIRRGDPDYRD